MNQDVTLSITMKRLCSAVESISDRLSIVENALKNTSQEQPPKLSKQEIRKRNIKECLEGISWKTIHDVMSYLNWTWVGQAADGSAAVPTIEAMKYRAESDLEYCFEEMDKYNNSNDGEPDSYFIYSGGLKVRTYPDDNCEIFFILSDYSTLE